MKSENKYIGDDSFAKMLQHYGCKMPLAVVKMRFIGSICSPNLELRPSDVIASLWEDGQSPRLETKEEAELFFKFFMGLWDEMFELVSDNKVKLSKYKNNQEGIAKICPLRFEEVEWGFVEGFWGGKDDLKVQAYIAEMIDSLSELSSVYNKLSKKLDSNDKLDEISKTLVYTDAMVEKAIAFIIENSVLPRIESLTRTVN